MDMPATTDHHSAPAARDCRCCNERGSVVERDRTAGATTWVCQVCGATTTHTVSRRPAARA